MLLAMHGWPLMIGVVTGARHWAVYGLGTNPGAQSATAAGAWASIPAAGATAHTAAAPSRANIKRADTAALSLCCRLPGYA